jgi:hypothetical protein
MRLRRESAPRARAAALARVAGLIALVASAPACLQLRLEKTRFLRPVPRATTSALSPGASLAECVERLGAPFFVWEQPQGAVALGYAWQYSKSWGLGVSGTVTRNVNASFDFDDSSADTHGFALWFDSEWKLVRIEHGRLRDLSATPARLRPNYIGLAPGAGAVGPRADENPK